MTQLRGCKKVWVTEAENRVRGLRGDYQAAQGPDHDCITGCVKDFQFDPKSNGGHELVFNQATGLSGLNFGTIILVAKWKEVLE